MLESSLRPASHVSYEAAYPCLIKSEPRFLEVPAQHVEGIISAVTSLTNNLRRRHQRLRCPNAPDGYASCKTQTDFYIYGIHQGLRNLCSRLRRYLLLETKRAISRENRYLTSACCPSDYRTHLQSFPSHSDILRHTTVRREQTTPNTRE